jgi:opacity protein-like surface antigen
MINKTVFAAALAAASLAGTAHAQALPTTPFSLEVRAGAAIPTGDLKEVAKTGYTVGANVSYAATPMVSIFGGYTMNSFGVKEDVTTEEGEAFPDDASLRVRVSGPEAGVRVNVPVAGSIAPFVKASALVNRFSLSISSDDASGTFGDDEWHVGFDVGAGVAIPLGPRISVTPAVSYVKVEDFKSVKADIGLAIRL